MPDAAPLTGLAVAEQPLAVLLPTGHPLAHRGSLRLFDLADAHWIDAPDTAVPLGQLRAAANTDGFRPRVTYGGTDVHGLGTLVAAGHGLAALPLSLTAALPGTAGIRLSALAWSTAPKCCTPGPRQPPRGSSSPGSPADGARTKPRTHELTEAEGAGARTLVRRCGR